MGCNLFCVIQLLSIRYDAQVSLNVALKLQKMHLAKKWHFQRPFLKKQLLLGVWNFVSWYSARQISNFSNLQIFKICQIRHIRFWKREKNARIIVVIKKNNLTAPFYGWGSTTSMLELLRGGSLLFTTKSPEIPGTHLL